MHIQTDKITYAVPCITAHLYRKITYAAPCITAHLYRKITYAAPCVTGYIYTAIQKRSLMLHRVSYRLCRAATDTKISLMHVTTSCSHVHFSGLAMGHGNAKLVTLRGYGSWKRQTSDPAWLWVMETPN